MLRAVFLTAQYMAIDLRSVLRFLDVQHVIEIETHGETNANSSRYYRTSPQVNGGHPLVRHSAR